MPLSCLKSWRSTFIRKFKITIFLHENMIVLLILVKFLWIKLTKFQLIKWHLFKHWPVYLFLIECWALYRYWILLTFLIFTCSCSFDFFTFLFKCLNLLLFFFLLFSHSELSFFFHLTTFFSRLTFFNLLWFWYW